MIRRTLLAALATLMIGSVPAVGQAWVTEGLNPDTFGPVAVSLADDATGGCWTNLEEATSYARAKLVGLGYTVIPAARGHFFISVHSERASNGACYGGTKVELWQKGTVNGLVGVLVMANKSAIFIDPENANTLVLYEIKSMIDDMAEMQRK